MKSNPIDQALTLVAKKFVKAGGTKRSSGHYRYAQGARMYSMNYYSFVKLAKEAGANIRIKKTLLANLYL